MLCVFVRPSAVVLLELVRDLENNPEPATLISSDMKIFETPSTNPIVLPINRSSSLNHPFSTNSSVEGILLETK
jgi:hypothetical protein